MPDPQLSNHDSDHGLTIHPILGLSSVLTVGAIYSAPIQQLSKVGWKTRRPQRPLTPLPLSQYHTNGNYNDKGVPAPSAHSHPEKSHGLTLNDDADDEYADDKDADDDDAELVAQRPNKMLLHAITAPEPFGKALFRGLLSVTFSYDPIGMGVPFIALAVYAGLHRIKAHVHHGP